MPMEGPGTGGGTTDCDVSPTDVLGQISNILNRLQACEAALASIFGTNVEALQLSDISNDLGWIYNVTYLGEEGWTQTPAGTLIPPPGWGGLSSIIDGQSGTIVSSGGGRIALQRRSAASASADFSGIFYITVNTDMPSDDDVTYIGGDYFTPGTDPSGNAGWECEVAGVYRVNGNITVTEGTTSVTDGRIHGRILKKDSIYTAFAMQTIGVPPEGLPSPNIAVFNLNGEILLDVGDFINLSISNNTDGDLKISGSGANMAATLVRTV